MLVQEQKVNRKAIELRVLLNNAHRDETTMHSGAYLAELTLYRFMQPPAKGGAAAIHRYTKQCHSKNRQSATTRRRALAPSLSVCVGSFLTLVNLSQLQPLASTCQCSQGLHHSEGSGHGHFAGHDLVCPPSPRPPLPSLPTRRTLAMAPSNATSDNQRDDNSE